MFGMILSVFIAFFLTYVTFFIFFNDERLNDYARIGISLCFLGFTIFYIIKWMSTFWR